MSKLLIITHLCNSTAAPTSEVSFSCCLNPLKPKEQPITTIFPHPSSSFPKMTFKISPALKEDVPAILDLLYDTFKAPYILEAFPNTPVVRRWWADCLYRSLEEEDQNVQMMVMVEETPDGKRKIGAFSKWSVEQGGRERTHWSERWCVELPDEMSKELVDGYYQGVEEQQARDMGQRRHWCKKPFFF